MVLSLHRQPRLLHEVVSLAAGHAPLGVPPKRRPGPPQGYNDTLNEAVAVQMIVKDQCAIGFQMLYENVEGVSSQRRLGVRGKSEML